MATTLGATLDGLTAHADHGDEGCCNDQDAVFTRLVHVKTIGEYITKVKITIFNTEVGRHLGGKKLENEQKTYMLRRWHLSRACPDSQLIRAKKAAILGCTPVVWTWKIFENLKDTS